MTSRVLIALVVIACSAVTAAAQTHRGTLRGTVLNPAGAPAPRLVLLVIHEGTGAVRKVEADDDGRYVAAELEPGTYRIEAEDPGYRRFAARAYVPLNQDVRLDLPLTLGAVATVDVKENIIMVDRDSPALGTTIENRLVTELPLDGRNFLELALLVPGTYPAPQGSAASVRGDFAFSAHGSREDFSNYLLDGIYNVDPKLGTIGVRPPVDAISQFQVLTSSYDATFGRNGGPQVNILTRSGTNRLAGTAYEFYRNRALSSRNYFAPEDEDKPEYSRHQFGGSVGGPLVRNQTFFFADYERTRLREGITRLTNVPTLAERRGDFSQSLFPRPVFPGTNTPFRGDVIPRELQDPRGIAIANLYPEPNRATPLANFVSSPILEDDIHQFDGRIDHTLGTGSQLTVRYSVSDRTLLEPFGGAGFSALPGFGNAVERRGHNLLGGLTQTLSATRLNDLRVGYNRVAIGVFPADPTLTNRTVGLAALTTRERDAGLSFITVDGFSPLGPEYNNPQESTSDALQVTDTLTMSRGDHLFKFGGEWHWVRQRAYRDVQARGFLTFSNQYLTGNALADLLLGFPVLTGGAVLDNPQNLRAHNWSAFVQDEWRVNPAVTVSAGLRYDYFSPPVDKDDRAALYDVDAGELVPVGTGGMPRGGYEPDRNNLAPRAGFAWTANEATQLVVRGGYGIYYNLGALATSEGLFFNPPYFNLNIFFPVSGRQPLTLANPFPANFPIPVPQSATAFQRDLETPWMEHWSFGVQRGLGRWMAAEIAYVGSRGHDLISARDVNQPSASPAFNPRPDPAFADITLIESRGSSRYNGLQFKFTKRSEASVSALLSYTYGRGTDDASGFFTSVGDPNFPQNSLDPEAERGRSAFDIRHRCSLAFSYPLPFGPERRWFTNGVLAKILSEMEVRAIYTRNSGRPFTVAVLPTIEVSNTGRSNLGFGFNDRPNVSGDTSVSSPSEDAWFNTAAFSFPAFGSFGNSGRNTLEGPGYQNLNLSIVKNVWLGLTRRLELRLEAFNLTNRANFDLPDPFLGSPTFGRILSAQSPRRWQLAAKYLF